MKSEHAKTFNEIATLYDKARIGYPFQIYEIIDIYSDITESSKILEIGCGTGIATEEIYDKWKSNIIAIDPGLQLLEIAREKRFQESKIEFIHCPYEELQIREKFDAIISATAFHWVDKRIKYKKSSDLLNENGNLILFWNNYVIEDNNVMADIQNIYTRYHPDGAVKDSRLHYKNKIKTRKNEINNSKYFDLIVHHESTYTISMTDSQYLNLLKSFSNNAYLENDKLTRFYGEVENYIKSTGNEIRITIVVNLEISKKI